MSRFIVGVVCLLGSIVIGCGGRTAEDGSADVYGSTSQTSGGEADDPTADQPTAPAERRAPVVLRTTIPVPVPQPAVPREEVSEPLQAVWTQVEEQVSMARPDSPEEITVANVQAWADGPFREWLDLRREALVATRALLEAVPLEPIYERALALALWAYAFEDLGAQATGAPVPTEIAQDDELRSIYIESLNEASVPLGRRAMELYADCRRRLVPLGDDSEWLPWRAYCVQRGLEIIEGYGLSPEPDPSQEEREGTPSVEPTS